MSATSAEDNLCNVNVTTRPSWCPGLEVAGSTPGLWFDWTCVKMFLHSIDENIGMVFLHIGIGMMFSRKFFVLNGLLNAWGFWIC